MAEHSTIEWTDATWNPITGCSIVSAGCTNCYAMGLAGTRLKHHPSRAGLTVDTKAGPVWNGQVRLNEAWLAQPIEWRRPRRIFVCAHGDLFAEGVPDAWIDRVFAVMALAPHHTFQVLTKRSARMRAYLSNPETPARVALLRVLASRKPSEPPPVYVQVNVASEQSRWPLKHIWLGVSAEDQRRADERVPDLLATPAAVRFVSAEPLLGPIDFTNLDNTGDCRKEQRHGISALWKTTLRSRLDWIVVGGESGPNARPMHPAWARSIRDQCKAAGVAFHFKQWGAWLPGQNDVYDGFGDGRRVAHWQDGRWGERNAPNPVSRNYVMWSPDGVAHPGGSRGSDGYFEVAAWASRVGKKAAGRLLDGVEHNGMPEALR